jgi:hypothetical protein
MDIIDNAESTKNFSNNLYLEYIYSLVFPYKNTKIHINKSNKEYIPSKLSICYSVADIYKLNIEENKKYLLIYYDINYENDFKD